MKKWKSAGQKSLTPSKKKKVQAEEGAEEILAEEFLEGEWADWYRLTPAERWLESEKLWQTYLSLGGSLDPEPDTQSPFFDAKAPGSRAAYGGPSVRVLRRGRV